MTGRTMAFTCDPYDENKYLACSGSVVECRTCKNGMKWDSKLNACGMYRRCLPTPPRCLATPTQPPTLPPTQPSPTLTDPKVTPIQRCVCKHVLQISGRQTALACDPASPDKYLFCFHNSIESRSCHHGLKWDYKRNACTPFHQCRPFPPHCGATVRPPLPTTTAPCINCGTTPLQRCICSASLKQSGSVTTFACDPHTHDRYLVCSGNSVTCEKCSHGMKWNVDINACVPMRKCALIPPQCDRSLIGGPGPVTGTSTCRVDYRLHSELMDW